MLCLKYRWLDKEDAVYILQWDITQPIGFLKCTAVWCINTSCNLSTFKFNGKWIFELFVLDAKGPIRLCKLVLQIYNSWRAIAKITTTLEGVQGTD